MGRGCDPQEVGASCQKGRLHLSVVMACFEMQAVRCVLGWEGQSSRSGCKPPQGMRCQRRVFVPGGEGVWSEVLGVR